MLQRTAPQRKKSSSKIDKAGSLAKTAIGQEIDAFIKETNLFYEVATRPDGKQVMTPKMGIDKSGGDAEQKIMEMFGWYWEPLLHDIAFLEQMRDNVPLIKGVFSKFTDLVMEGFTLECEDPADNEEVNDLLLNDPTVDFGEVVRSAVWQLVTIANCYFKPIYIRDEKGFRVETFRPIRATAMRKLRDENLVVRGYVQLLHRPSEFLFGTPTTPTMHLAADICCGVSYTDGWYAYGVPPLAALPFIAKMKLQMERDLVEMLHLHVPRIDVTYTPDPQMNDDQVADQIDKAKKSIAEMSPTDNYIHTPDFIFEYKGPNGKAIDPSEAMRYIAEQLYAVLPLISGYLSSDLNINPMLAQQSFRLCCSLANYIRTRINVMFRPTFDKLEAGRGVSRIKASFANLDVETAETQARTQEYNSANAASNRDNGFIDQDAAASHATNGKVKQAAKPGAIPPPVDPNKTPPAAPGAKSAPASKGGKSKVGDGKKGPKSKNRSAPTPDKRPKGKRHESAELDNRVAELRGFVETIT